MPTHTTTTVPCSARGCAVPWSDHVVRILTALLLAALKVAAPAQMVEAAEMAGLSSSTLASVGAVLLVGTLRKAFSRTEMLGGLLLARCFRGAVLRQSTLSPDDIIGTNASGTGAIGRAGPA